jgi:hypothetical protein
MKLIVGLLMTVFAASAFAYDSARETVARIEMDKNVRCDYIKSSFNFCIGTPRELATCRYTQTYQCYGVESFKLKLKMKEFYSNRTNSRESVVTSIKYE